MKQTPATAADLARAECAAYVHGTCGGERPCAVEAGQTCHYFEAAVLPLHPGVGYGEPAQAEPAPVAHCSRCGSEYVPSGRHALYCPACAVEARRERTRERVARHWGWQCNAFRFPGVLRYLPTLSRGTRPCPLQPVALLVLRGSSCWR